MSTLHIQKTAVRGLLVLLTASLWLTTSCSTGEVQAGTAGASDLPTVAVASVVTDNLSSVLMLTASAKSALAVAKDQVAVKQAELAKVHALLHRSFPERVVRFADKVSLTTRTMDTEVDVPNPSLALIPEIMPK